MKILVLNWYDILNPIAGGAERYLFEIFSRLAAKGHAVTLVCHSFAGGSSTASVMGIRVLRLPKTSRGLTAQAVKTILGAFTYYSRHRKEYDIVVDFVNKVPHFTPLYVAKRQRLALQCHFNGETFPLEYPGVGWLLQAIEHLYFRLFYCRERFVVISPSTQADLDRYGIDCQRSVLIRSGIARPSVQRVPSQEPSIVYLGRLQRYKSVDLLLKAMALVLAKIPQARLRIVGHGRDGARLKELAKTLDIEASVDFEGYVSEQTKWEILSQAWVHVNPSRKEGWGLNVLEAAHCRVPSVAARVPGLRDSVLDGVTGRLVEHGNVPQLAGAIAELLLDDAKRQEMGSRAYDFSQSFDWNVVADQMEEVLESTSLS
jgi:glycosyltransferase involved in cell wall biosynthesis